MIRAWNSNNYLCFLFIFCVLMATPTGSKAGDKRFNDDTGSASQLNPESAMSRFGAAVFVWEDVRNGGVELYGQKFSMKGLAAGDNFTVTRAGWGGMSMNPDVAMDDHGRFVVVWDEKGKSGQDVYGKLFAANGTAIREEFEIAGEPDAGESTGSAAVAMDSSGNFTVCWNWRSGHQSDVFIRRYDATGEASGPARRINAQLTGYSRTPAIGMNRKGTFVVAWEDNLNGVTDIVAQRFDNTGAMVGGNFEVSGFPGQTNPAWEPSVDVLDDYEERQGFFCVVYACKGPGDLASDIHAYVYYGAGNARTVAVSDSSLAAEDRHPDVTSAGVRGYQVVWQSSDGSDIYARSFGNSGYLSPSSLPERVNETAGDQKAPCVTFGNENTLFAWEDNRNGNSDIYAQWDGTRCPTYVNAGSGFKGMIPLSWDPAYGDDTPVSYKIYRFRTTRDSLDMMIQSGYYPQFVDFDYVTTVDPRTRAFPRLMLDWIDRDVIEGKIYRYAVQADVEVGDGITHTLSRDTAAPSSGFSIASKWTETAPVIDGTLVLGEWMGATEVSVRNPDAPEPVMLYVMNDENALYIAALDRNDVIVDPLNFLGFTVDKDRSGSWDAALPSDEGAYQITSTAAAFTGYYGSTPEGFRMMGMALSPADLQGAVSASIGYVEYEARLDIPAAPGSTIGFAAWVNDPGALYRRDFSSAGEWPPGALWDAAETLGDMILATGPNPVTERPSEEPGRFSLGRNFPNPFNPETRIPYHVRESCRVTLKVYDLLAHEIAVLADGNYAAGNHSVLFDATGLPSGIYLYSIRMGDFTAVRKMALMK
jgi:hypothetical protein